MSTTDNSCCPLCGDNSIPAQNAMAEYTACVPGSGVCGQCAERVANAFSMKHGGKWLTWANPPVQLPKKAVINQAIRTAVFERDMYRCLRCGTHLGLRADHIIPESQGGPAEVENLQTLCQPCNSWKGVKTIDFREAAR